MLHLNDEIRELIVARAPIRRIKEAARAQRHPLLARVGARSGESGETTLQEINRVTFVA